MDISAQLTALQAKIIGRLLQPNERVPWKATSQLICHAPYSRAEE